MEPLEDRIQGLLVRRRVQTQLLVGSIVCVSEHPVWGLPMWKDQLLNGDAVEVCCIACLDLLLKKPVLNICILMYIYSIFRFSASSDREANNTMLLISSVLLRVEWFLSLCLAVWLATYRHWHVLCMCACVPPGHTGSAMLIAGLGNQQLQLPHLCWAAGLGKSQK